MISFNLAASLKRILLLGLFRISHGLPQQMERALLSQSRGASPPISTLQCVNKWGYWVRFCCCAPKGPCRSHWNTKIQYLSLTHTHTHTPACSDTTGPPVGLYPTHRCPLALASIQHLLLLLLSLFHSLVLTRDVATAAEAGIVASVTTTTRWKLRPFALLCPSVLSLRKSGADEAFIISVLLCLSTQASLGTRVRLICVCLASHVKWRTVRVRWCVTRNKGLIHS